MAKVVSDEAIIAAIISNGTIKAAAAAVGLTTRAVYDRMNESEFQALYKAAKGDILRQAVFSISGKLETAVNTVCEIMENCENNPAVRLQAAQTLLNNAARFVERLAKDEQRLAKDAECNTWGLF